MKPHRSLRALLVDVPPAHGRVLERALAEAGWRLDAEHAAGAEGLSAALSHRGWHAVLYGGDGAGAVPARKALALVRLADPYLPFLAVSPYVQAGALAAIVRGLDGVAVVPDPARLPAALSRALDATRLRRRVGGAHRLLRAQQAITDAIAAGLETDELAAHVLATLGDTLGWSCGVVWRPAADGLLRSAGTWHAGTRPEVAALAAAADETVFAPGQGLPGRVYAFRRPAWVADVGRGGDEPRSAAARRAGLMTAVAFPLAHGDRCAGVIEFFSQGINEPNAEVSALFATVGGQLGQYLERRRHERGTAAAGEAAAGDERLRRMLDATGALVAVLDAGGRVRLAGDRMCAALGVAESDLAGGDWAEAAVPVADRVAFAAALAAAGGAPATVLHPLAGTGQAVLWRIARVEDGDEPLVLVTGTPPGAASTGAIAGPDRAGLDALSTAAELHLAMEHGQLELHWQPIYALRSSRLAALEALLRWNHPERGLVGPAEFIPVAEATGVIEPLGDWVLDAVCAQQAAWAQDGLHPQLSFNVSPTQLRRADFVERVAARLHAWDADASRLTVELTESSTLEDPASAEPLVRGLHALGLRIALDDFGSGYSSLSRLRELPVTMLKIDRAFMRDLPERTEAAAIVTAILQLAGALGRVAVAEGVETEAQRAFLAEQGCPLAQGYLLGRPMPADEAARLMAAPGPRRELSPAGSAGGRPSASLPSA
jgi:EAL domain-containing protein (putative c-di-GMP-specific phosphodiesterase class I)/PAS domain-containing protein